MKRRTFLKRSIITAISIVAGSILGPLELLAGTDSLSVNNVNKNPLDIENVRCLLAYIKKTLSQSMRTFIGEVNDNRTRHDLSNMVNPFMNDLKEKRKLYDYIVVCDETNNSPEYIDKGYLRLDVFMKPIISSEMIRLDFVEWTKIVLK